MKTLFFLLAGVFCYAHGQTPPKEDSTINVVSEKVTAVKKINQENEILIKQLIDKNKAEKMAKDLKSKPTPERISDSKEVKVASTIEAVRAENIKPVIEVDFKVYEDSIRGGFFYRLLHKEDFKIKYYKIVNDEKIYLN